MKLTKELQALYAVPMAKLAVLADITGDRYAAYIEGVGMFTTGQEEFLLTTCSAYAANMVLIYDSELDTFFELETK
jgi:hypothetical protein